MFRTRLLTALLSLPVPLWADADSQQPDAAEIVKVVTLASAGAEQVMGAIHELGFPIRSSVVAENRLVLRGSAADIQTVLEELVAKIDVPEVSAGSATVDYIQLSQKPLDTFQGLLEVVAPRGVGTHYAIDRESRLIAINAPKERVAAMRKLVEAMDRPTASFLIHFYFLRGRVGGAAAEKSREGLPRDLVSVTAALQNAGFGELSLVAPLIIQGVDGESFQSTVAQPRDGREEGDDLGIHVRGKPFADGTGGVVQLEIEVQLSGRAVQKKESGTVVTYPMLLAAESTITVKLDSCVVLAAAPTAGANGEAYAVVIKITRASPGKQ